MTRSQPRRTFERTHEDKPFFPEVGLRKGDLIDYYARVAEVMLPHVRGRIVAMQRYPDGVGGKSFYQKAVPDYFPDWIHTVTVRKQSGGSLRQLTIEHAEDLAYLANQGCIAIHVWPSRADKPKHPDRMIFDLDPSDDDFACVRDAARRLRVLLQRLQLPAYVMTTGSRGLHVVTPLDRSVDFDRVRAFAVRLARVLCAEDPERFTLEQRKHKRGKRLFVDCMRNAYAQHAIAPYSVRARPEAPVATPLDWQELSRASLHPRKYTLQNLCMRLAHKPDPFAGIARAARALGPAQRGLEALMKERGVG